MTHAMYNHEKYDNFIEFKRNHDLSLFEELVTVRLFRKRDCDNAIQITNLLFVLIYNCHCVTFIVLCILEIIKLSQSHIMVNLNERFI